MPVIRAPLPKDFAAIAVIFQESISHTAARDYTKQQRAAWIGSGNSAKRWRNRTKALEVRLAWIENSPAGFIGYATTGHIDLLFIHPAYARRGIARALLLDAENDLIQRKIATAWTEVSLTARAFFDTMGYTLVREQAVRCNGVDLKNYRMEKALLPDALPSPQRAP